nr:hypothetical protein [Marinicella sp. W31]MDC2878883.1 hypothetical protein [Marinicella sp. W31]
MLFDWAAQPFFTVIITFIFGPYFVSELGSDPVAGQTAWAHAATIAGVLVALGAPFAGALSDTAGRNKRFIGEWQSSRRQAWRCCGLRPPAAAISGLRF